MDYKNNLKALRKQRNLTLEELSKRTGISPTYLRALEAGLKRLNEDSIKVLADFYNVTYDYLLARTRGKLAGKNYHITEIDKVISSPKFIDEAQKKAIYLLSLLNKEDLRTVEVLTKQLLTKGDKDDEKTIDEYLDKFGK